MHTTAALPLLLFAAMTQTAAQTDTDFEAALRTPHPARAATSAPKPATVRAAKLRQVPPAGTLPQAWRSPITGRGMVTAAERAADQGEIDAITWIEHHVGAIPLPPGARPMRCEPSGLRATYTLGIEASAAFRKAIDDRVREQLTAAQTPVAKGAGRRGIASEAVQRLVAQHGTAETLPATAAKLREVRAFLRAKGFVQVGSGFPLEIWRHADAQVGRPTIDVTLLASPMSEAIDCGIRGVTMPSGPMMYVAPVYPTPDWRDRINPASIR